MLRLACARTYCPRPIGAAAGAAPYGIIMAQTSLPDLDELKPVFIGLVLGVCLLVFFVVLCLVVGLTPAIEFGIPHQ